MSDFYFIFIFSEGSNTADCGTFKRLPEGSRPTHVVTAISYGGNAHIVFSKVSSVVMIDMKL